MQGLRGRASWSREHRRWVRRATGHLAGRRRAFSVCPFAGAVVAAVAVVVGGVAATVVGSVVEAVVVPGSAYALTAGGANGGEGPGGTVSVGASDGSSTGGAPGAPSGTGGTATGSVPGRTGGSGGSGGPGRSGGSGATGGSTASGGGPKPVCTYTPLTLNTGAGFAPGGPTPGAWYSVTCVYPGPAGAMTTQTVWVADATASTGAPTTTGPAFPAVDPRTLALQAERSIRLPSPVLRFDPSPATVVNLPTWLWIDPRLWTPVSVSATAGSVTATAVATPVSVVWTMGDGATVACDGPGTPFEPTAPTSGQSTDCSYAYPVSSAGRPSPDGDPDHAAFTVIATVTWSVRWSAQGAVGGGQLPDLTTSGSAPLRVEQVESVNTGLTAFTVRGVAPVPGGPSPAPTRLRSYRPLTPQEDHR